MRIHRVDTRRQGEQPQTEQSVFYCLIHIDV